MKKSKQPPSPAGGELTEAQRSVLEAAMRAEVRLGESATLGQIGEEHGTTFANVRGILQQLVPSGFVGERARGKHKSYVVLKTPLGEPFDRNVTRQHRHESPIRIRIEGEIAAGPSVEPTDGPSLVELPGLTGTPPGHFWLRVKGSSMSRAGILPGSLVYCRRQSDVSPGEIAVCMLEDETVTLKCVVADRKNGRVKLVPKCDGLEAVTYRSVEIQARVLYVLRQV